MPGQRLQPLTRRSPMTKKRQPLLAPVRLPSDAFAAKPASSLAYWSPPSHVAGLQSRLRAGAWQGEAAGRKRGLLRKAVRVRRVARAFHVGVASSRRFVYVRWQLRHPVSRWFARRKAPLWQEMRSAWSTHSDRGQPGSQTQRPRRS
jgi:hypothetical protein